MEGFLISVLPSLRGTRLELSPREIGAGFGGSSGVGAT